MPPLQQITTYNSCLAVKSKIVYWLTYAGMASTGTSAFPGALCHCLTGCCPDAPVVHYRKVFAWHRKFSTGESETRLMIELVHYICIICWKGEDAAHVFQRTLPMDDMMWEEYLAAIENMEHCTVDSPLCNFGWIIGMRAMCIRRHPGAGVQTTKQ